MAGVATAPGDGLRRREFWWRQLQHQAPMIAAMILMATVLRGAIGLLVIVAGLWVVALVRARAARTSVRAREFLVDILAMALVLVVPLLHANPPTSSGMAMPGMTGASLGGRAAALVLVLVWGVVRVALLRQAGARDRRTESAVSGGCCAVGLAAMLVL